VATTVDLSIKLDQGLTSVLILLLLIQNVAVVSQLHLSNLLQLLLLLVVVSGLLERDLLLLLFLGELNLSSELMLLDLTKQLLFLTVLQFVLHGSLLIYDLLCHDFTTLFPQMILVFLLLTTILLQRSDLCHVFVIDQVLALVCLLLYL